MARFRARGPKPAQKMRGADMAPRMVVATSNGLLFQEARAYQGLNGSEEWCTLISGWPSLPGM